MPLSSGARLGPYEIVAPLGAGGMGEVYAARDTRLDRDVAVKVLPDAFASDADRVARFGREAKSVASLSHPNILAIFDTGSHDGRMFVVTELLQGRTLRDTLAPAGAVTSGSAMAVRTAIDTAIQIARGLAAAHDKGIVHRDLKPENVFLTNDGQVKILDFGLARQMTAGSGTTTTAMMTDPGTVMGTVGYMSPEQVRGEAADARADLFALGAVLYEMVAGRSAFARDTPPETLTAILREEPPELPATRVDLPPALDRIMRHCLEKNPRQRFQTARDVAFALEALSSPPATLAATAGRRRRLGAMPLAVALVVGVAVIVSSVLAYRQLSARAPIDSVAILPFVNTAADQSLNYLSDGIAESLIYSLSEVSTLRVVPRNSAFQFNSAQVDIARAARDLNVGSIVTGRLAKHGDRLSVSADLVDVRSDKVLWGRQYDVATGELPSIQQSMASEISRALRVAVGERDATRLARRPTDDGEAYRLYLEGRYYWSLGLQPESNYRRAIDAFQRAIERDPRYALAHAGLADVYGNLPFWHVMAAAEARPKAEAAIDRALELDGDLAEGHAALAWIKLLAWDWAAATREVERAIQLKPKLGVPHTTYALIHVSQGRHTEAMAEGLAAAALDPLDTETAVLIGALMLYDGKVDGAIAQLERVRGLDPGHGNTHYWLGRSYLWARRYSEGVDALEKAQSLLGEDVQDEKAELILAYARWGKTKEARARLDELLSDKRTLFPGTLATAYAGFGDADRVLGLLDRGCREHDMLLIELPVSTTWDPFRSDPRFAQVMKCVGLAAKP